MPYCAHISNFKFFCYNIVSMKIDLELIKSLFDLTDEELMGMFKGFDVIIEIDNDDIVRFYVDAGEMARVIMHGKSFLSLYVKQPCDP